MMDQELRDINHRISQIELEAADNSRNPETVIAVGDNSSDKNDSAHSNSKSTNVSAAKVGEGEEDNGKCPSGSIEVVVVNPNDSVGESQNQRVCRVCHLSAKESGLSSTELIELGCGCKGELGIAHLHCAEAWFRLKGNRLCEICGETAKNITGVSDNGFMEEWYEGRSVASGDITRDGRRRCFRGQPLCNFLMACLVIAFVLPWFFRINMF